MISRRHVVIGLALVGVTPAALPAQTRPSIPRIGYMAIGDGPAAAMFREGMRELGYIDGQTIAVEYRWHRNQAQRRAEQAADLVRLGVKLIVAVGPDTVDDALRATRTIPVVMFYSADPVLMGWVQNLARPGGNLTGFAWDAGFEYVGKCLELLREALPLTSRLAILWNSNNASHRPYLRAFSDFASRVNVAVVSLPASRREDFAPAFSRAKQEDAHAIVIFPDPLTFAFRSDVAALISQQRLPAIIPGDVKFDGALLSYGPVVADQPRRAAGYVDRVLKGARPGDLPIEQPTEYRIVVSAKAARALGVTIPPSLLLRADRVIE